MYYGWYCIAQMFQTRLETDHAGDHINTQESWLMPQEISQLYPRKNPGFNSQFSKVVPWLPFCCMAITQPSAAESGFSEVEIYPLRTDSR